MSKAAAPPRFDVDDTKIIAEHASAFLEDAYGQWVIERLSDEYNKLHQAAESEAMTIEQKAFKVERAAGVKVAIDLLTANAQLLEGGAFEEDAAPE